jgi:exonuclease III
MHVVSYNMQGLCGRGRASRVRDFIKNHKPPLDIFCGQEHHIRGGSIKMLPFQLWREADFIVAPALDGVIAGRSDRAESGKRGLLIAIGPAFKTSIVDKGTLTSQRGVWVVFEHPRLGRFGILYIYAPTGNNALAERQLLWSCR